MYGAAGPSDVIVAFLSSATLFCVGFLAIALGGRTQMAASSVVTTEAVVKKSNSSNSNHQKQNSNANNYATASPSSSTSTSTSTSSSTSTNPNSDPALAPPVVPPVAPPTTPTSPDPASTPSTPSTPSPSPPSSSTPSSSPPPSSTTSSGLSCEYKKSGILKYFTALSKWDSNQQNVDTVWKPPSFDSVLIDYNSIKPNTRVYVIGDLEGRVHLMYDWLISLDLIKYDAKEDVIEWLGDKDDRDTYVIQCGDQNDAQRVDDPNHYDLTTILFMEYMRHISNGRVISLLGNHEIWAASTASNHYVSKKNANTDKALFNRKITRMGLFAPDHIMGRCLRSRPFVARIGNLFFNHAGISNHIATMTMTPRIFNALKSSLTLKLNKIAAPLRKRDELEDVSNLLPDPPNRNFATLQHLDSVFKVINKYPQILIDMDWSKSSRAIKTPQEGTYAFIQALWDDVTKRENYPSPKEYHNLPSTIMEDMIHALTWNRLYTDPYMRGNDEMPNMIAMRNWFTKLSPTVPLTTVMGHNPAFDNVPEITELPTVHVNPQTPNKPLNIINLSSKTVEAETHMEQGAAYFVRADALNRKQEEESDVRYVMFKVDPQQQQQQQQQPLHFDVMETLRHDCTDRNVCNWFRGERILAYCFLNMNPDDVETKLTQINTIRNSS